MAQINKTSERSPIFIAVLILVMALIVAVLIGCTGCGGGGGGGNPTNTTCNAPVCPEGQACLNPCDGKTYRDGKPID